MTKMIKLMSNWEDVMFSESSDEPTVGSRLGIQYKESLKEYLTIRLHDGLEYRLYQDSMGVMAISGVAWDAGLYLVDLLVQLSINRRFCQVDNHQPIDDDHFVNNKIFSIDNDIDNDIKTNYINSSIHDHNYLFGCTLDIGCGTGIGGITALLLGAEYVLFTDMHKRSCLDDTLNQLQQQQLLDKTAFISYEWNELVIDERIKSYQYTLGTSDDDGDMDNGYKKHNTSGNSISNGEDQLIKYWDTVICSDLLYEAANHMKLLNVLQGIKFNRAFISYKKRHHIPEAEFFRRISQSFNIFLCDPKSITLNNLPASALSGLYLLLIIPKSVMN